MAQQPKRLYVVFHGLFLFFHRKNGRRIEAYMPDLREKRMNGAGGVETHSPHVYLAGNWLAETTIAPGADLALEGATGGDARFSRTRHIVVEAPNKRSTAVPYAKLTFPRPLEIISLREIDVKPGVDIIGASVDRIAGTKLVTIPVFRYDVPDETLLRLGNHPWIPAAVDGTITLHVFAEPEVPQGLEHSHREFEKAFALLEGVDLRLAKALPLPPIGPDVVLPPGLQRQELEDLVARRRRMEVLGRLQKGGGNPGEAWRQDDVYGENPAACTGAGADDDPDD